MVDGRVAVCKKSNALLATVCANREIRDAHGGKDQAAIDCRQKICQLKFFGEPQIRSRPNLRISACMHYGYGCKEGADSE